MGLIKAIHIIIPAWIRPVPAAKGNEVLTHAYAYETQKKWARKRARGRVQT